MDNFYVPQALAQDVPGFQQWLLARMYTNAPLTEEEKQTIYERLEPGNEYGLLSLAYFYRPILKVPEPWNPPVSKRKKRHG